MMQDYSISKSQSEILAAEARIAKANADYVDKTGNVPSAPTAVKEWQGISDYLKTQLGEWWKNSLFNFGRSRK